MLMMMTMTITGMRMPKAGLSDTLLIGISAPSHDLTCVIIMIVMIYMCCSNPDHDDFHFQFFSFKGGPFLYCIAKKTDIALSTIFLEDFYYLALFSLSSDSFYGTVSKV